MYISIFIIVLIYTIGIILSASLIKNAIIKYVVIFALFTSIIISLTFFTLYKNENIIDYTSKILGFQNQRFMTDDFSNKLLSPKHRNLIDFLYFWKKPAYVRTDSTLIIYVHSYQRSGHNGAYPLLGADNFIEDKKRLPNSEDFEKYMRGDSSGELPFKIPIISNIIKFNKKKELTFFLVDGSSKSLEKQNINNWKEKDIIQNLGTPDKTWLCDNYTKKAIKVNQFYFYLTKDKLEYIVIDFDGSHDVNSLEFFESSFKPVNY